jgi:uncharacterized protein (TIGR00251 family)
VTDGPTSSWVSAQGDGVRLAVRVTPRAAKSTVQGIHTDAGGQAWLAVRLTAPPEAGKANAALIKFLAKRWRLATNDFRLLAGATARRKVLHVQGPPVRLLAELRAVEQPASVNA